VEVWGLKVLIVTPHIFAGGAEKAVLNLVYHLNSMGCDASIATLSLDLSKLPAHFRKLIFLLPKKPLDPAVMNGVGSVLTSSLSEMFSFVMLLRKFSGEFDLICACNFPAYWATYVAWTGKPVMWLSSEVLGPYNQTKDVYDRSGFFRLALKIASAIDKYVVNRGFDPIVTCSALNSQLIKERYGRDSMVLNTGVDYDFFSTKVPDAKVRLGLGDGIVLLHVGALMQRKNQILSIRALQILKQRLGSVKLALVGEGPWEPILRQEVEKLGLEQDVIFTGCISEDGLRNYYNACDVNLFPVKDQTWGLVPFEALVVGKISVVAEGCGAAEVIAKEQIGLLIKPCVEDLAEAVLCALNNPELMADMVGRGQRFVRENFTWEKYARDMCGVFRRVLGSGSK
jgi:glycosyltransferase involved in cell wall biosynthesis